MRSEVLRQYMYLSISHADLTTVQQNRTLPSIMLGVCVSLKFFGFIIRLSDQQYSDMLLGFRSRACAH